MKTNLHFAFIAIALTFILLFTDGCNKSNPTGPLLSNGLTSSRATFSLRLFQQDTCSISGGTRRYAVSSKPDSTVALYGFYGSQLFVFGIASGSTAITIVDDSSHWLTIPISVVVPPGKISFDATDGNFSASGKLDVNFLFRGGEGCGALGNHFYNNMLQQVMILGYKFYSATDAGVIGLTLSDTVAITTRTYTIGKNASIVYVLHGNPHSSTMPYDTLSSGSLTLTSLTNENIKGTFSGSGKNSITGQTVSITNGTFDCPLFAWPVYVTAKTAMLKNLFPKNSLRPLR
ncbi:MAG: hypothetical protein KGJ59_05545 [Bacteroidota bacterium]|nr:hypothetical protein [Bacteroidota bacterium]